MPPTDDPRGCPRCAHGIGNHQIDCPNAVSGLSDAALELSIAQASLGRIESIYNAVISGALPSQGMAFDKIGEALRAYRKAKA